MTILNKMKEIKEIALAAEKALLEVYDQAGELSDIAPEDLEDYLKEYTSASWEVIEAIINLVYWEGE